MYFTDTEYNLVLSTNRDLTTASSLSLAYSNNKRQSGTWTPTANGQTATFQITDSMIPTPSIYKVQLVAVISGITYRSNFMQITFDAHL